MKNNMECNIPIYMQEDMECIRIRDIPNEFTRKKFQNWMTGQTRPLFTKDDEKVDWDEQDYYYMWDYLKFCSLEKTGRKETAEEWD